MIGSMYVRTTHYTNNYKSLEGVYKMLNKINLMCVGGPYGDCTSLYEFTMPKQMALKEFAEMVAELE
jgi:hypothetical protein